VKSSSITLGLLTALLAAATFGLSGALIKPLLESGWSPAAAVTLRALVGGIVLTPFALGALRGRGAAFWRGRWRVVAMALVGVAGTQLIYFAALQRIPVGTAVLIEYLAPLLLIGFAWVNSRKRPKPVVLVGSVVALAGLVLVVAPAAHGSFDPLGLFFAALAMVGCTVYYLVAARPGDELPPVALAASSLLIGGVVIGVIGLTGVVPFTATFGNFQLLGNQVPWWLPLLIVGVFATAIAYAAGITASGLLGARLASFLGLLEVVAATLYAWILLGENLSVPQLVGGLLILIGIAFVRADRSPERIERVETSPANSLAPLP